MRFQYITHDHIDFNKELRSMAKAIAIKKGTKRSEANLRAIRITNIADKKISDWLIGQRPSPVLFIYTALRNFYDYTS